MVSKAERKVLSTARKVEMMSSLIRDVEAKIRNNTQIIRRLATENSILKENRAYLNQHRHALQKGIKL